MHMQHISNKEIVREIGNRQLLNRAEGIGSIHASQRDHKIGIQSKRETEKCISEGCFMYQQHRKEQLWLIREWTCPELIFWENVLLHLDFGNNQKGGGGKGIRTAIFYTDLSPRMSVLGILWSTDTGICFLLEHSYPRSYTAHLRKGLVIDVKAELLLSARFRRNITIQINFRKTSRQFHNEC